MQHTSKLEFWRWRWRIETNKNKHSRRTCESVGAPYQETSHINDRGWIFDLAKQLQDSLSAVRSPDSSSLVKCPLGRGWSHLPCGLRSVTTTRVTATNRGYVNKLFANGLSAAAVLDSADLSCDDDKKTPTMEMHIQLISTNDVLSNYQTGIQ